MEAVISAIADVVVTVVILAIAFVFVLRKDS
jgi:hypothetical protein